MTIHDDYSIIRLTNEPLGYATRSIAKNCTWTVLYLYFRAFNRELDSG